MNEKNEKPLENLSASIYGAFWDSPSNLFYTPKDEQELVDMIGTLMKSEQRLAFMYVQFGFNLLTKKHNKDLQKISSALIDYNESVDSKTE